VKDFSVEDFRAELERYASISADQLRTNLHDFLSDIMPVAEKYGIRMAIHPDDPPWTIFGLPRIMNCESDYRALIKAVPSPSNGITLCTGSLGARPENNAAALFEAFADRVYFAHFRNVRFDAARPGSFHESPCHLEGATDMQRAMTALVNEEERRKMRGETEWQIPLRPDHGKLFDRDREQGSYAGYSGIGRMIGLAELRGLEYSIRKTRGLS
jgi:mannonate dehydratase